MIVGDLGDRRQRIQKLRVLEVVAEKFVLDRDLSTRTVEEELPVLQSSVPVVQSTQQDELALVVEYDLVENTGRDLHDGAVTDRLDGNRKSGAAVSDDKSVSCLGLVRDAFLLQREPRQFDGSRDGILELHDDQL